MSLADSIASTQTLRVLRLDELLERDGGHVAEVRSIVDEHQALHHGPGAHLAEQTVFYG